MKRRKGKGEKKTRTKRKPTCVECGSRSVLPIFYGLPSRRMSQALTSGRAVVADREDWEGLPQWHCENCGCQWRGEWRRFKLRALASTR